MNNVPVYSEFRNLIQQLGYTRSMTQEMDRLKASTNRYKHDREAADASREEVIQAVLVALRAGERPTDVAEASPFTYTYIRRMAREAGVVPATPGPKPSRK
jgi:hypothetical protein